MSSSPRIIAIAGITSKLALKTVEILLENPDITIHGFGRNPSKLPESVTSNPRIKLFTASAADSAATRAAIAGSDTVICFYLGGNDIMIDGQKALIDACIAEGVKRYIASDYSIDYRELEFGQIPPKDPMKHVYAYLQERKGQIAGVHILNGVFMELFWSFAGHFSNTNGEYTFTYWGDGDQILEATTYDDTARMAAATALDENATGIVTVLGDRKSVKDVAKLFEEEYGAKPVLKKGGELADLEARYKKALAETPQDWWTWMQDCYNYNMMSGYGIVPKPLTSEEYGLKTTDHRAFLRMYTKDTVNTAFTPSGA